MAVAVMSAGQVHAAPADPSGVTGQAAAAPSRFPIYAFDVTGVTRLGSAEIERLIYPFAGPDKSAADVEAARKAIQDAYAARGFEAVIVDIPPQPSEAFAQGLVQLRVNEAPVANVKITGAKFHSASGVRKDVPAAVEGAPLDLKRLQSDLAAANRFPDRTITPSFRAGKDPGTIDVELKVKDSLPLHASVEVNNDNSPNTTRLRVTGSARYTNLWGAGHTLSASYIVAPERPKDTSVWSGSYSAPLIGTPWTLLAYGYTSNSDIAALGGTNVLGDGYQIGLRAIYRLPIEAAYHAFSIGVDYKDFNQNITLAGQLASKAPLRYVPLNLGYTYSQSGEKSALEVNLSATLGLRIIKRVGCLDATPGPCLAEDQFTNKDVDSRENFAHVNLDTTYTRAITGDWSAAIKLSGQYADGHLVTNEQYAIGGQTSVRGYFQSEVVGDKGLAGSIELRLPSIADKLPSFVDELRVFSFVDGGIVGVIDPLPDQDDFFKIAGVGGGVRLRMFKRLSGEATLGLPLLTGPNSRRGDPRFTFVAKGEF